MINNLSRGLSPPFSPTTPSVTQTTPTRIFNLASSVPRPPPISINPTLRRTSPTITSNNNPAVSNQRTKPNIPSHSTSLSSTLTELELLERLDWDLRTGRNDQLSIRRDSDGSILTDGVRDRWGNRWSLENHVLSPVISERTEPSRTDVSSPTSNLSVSSYSTSANNRRLRSNVSTSSSSTSKSSRLVLPPHTSSSSSTTTTPSSSTSAVVIDHPLPNLENYTKSLDQNLPQTDSNCQLSSLEGDHEQFILSLHRNTLNSRGDSKNNHQSSHLKQLRAQQARERDLAIADRQIQKRLERENREKMVRMRDEILRRLVVHPNDPKLVRDLGKVYLRNHSSSQQPINKRDLSSNQSPSKVGKSEASLKLSIHYLEQSIQLDSRDPQTWLYLGRAWALLLHHHPSDNPQDISQRLSNSSLGYRKSISIAKNTQPINIPRLNRFRLAYAEYLEDLKKYKEAVEVLQDGLEADSMDAECWWELGRMMELWTLENEDEDLEARVQRLRQGCEAYRKAIEIESDDQMMRDGLRDGEKLLRELENELELKQSDAVPEKNTSSEQTPKTPTGPSSLNRLDNLVKEQETSEPDTCDPKINKIEIDLMVIPEFGRKKVNTPPRVTTTTVTAASASENFELLKNYEKNDDDDDEHPKDRKKIDGIILDDKPSAHENENLENVAPEPSQLSSPNINSNCEGIHQRLSLSLRSPLDGSKCYEDGTADGDCRRNPPSPSVLPMPISQALPRSNSYSSTKQTISLTNNQAPTNRSRGHRECCDDRLQAEERTRVSNGLLSPEEGSVNSCRSNRSQRSHTRSIRSCFDQIRTEEDLCDDLGSTRVKTNGPTRPRLLSSPVQIPVKEVSDSYYPGQSLGLGPIEQPQQANPQTSSTFKPFSQLQNQDESFITLSSVPDLGPPPAIPPRPKSCRTSILSSNQLNGILSSIQHSTTLSPDQFFNNNHKNISNSNNCNNSSGNAFSPVSASSCGITMTGNGSSCFNASGNSNCLSSLLARPIDCSDYDHMSRCTTVRPESQNRRRGNRQLRLNEVTRQEQKDFKVQGEGEETGEGGFLREKRTDDGGCDRRRNNQTRRKFRVSNLIDEHLQSMIEVDKAKREQLVELRAKMMKSDELADLRRIEILERLRRKLIESDNEEVEVDHHHHHRQHYRCQSSNSNVKLKNYDVKDSSCGEEEIKVRRDRSQSTTSRTDSTFTGHPSRARNVTCHSAISKTASKEPLKNDSSDEYLNLQLQQGKLNKGDFSGRKEKERRRRSWMVSESIEKGGSILSSGVDRSAGLALNGINSIIQLLQSHDQL